MASGLGGGRGSIARQSVLLSVFCSDDEEASDVIDFRGAAGGMFFTDANDPTSFAVYAAPDESGPFVPLSVDGEAVVITASENGAFILPDSVFAAPFLKLEAEAEVTIKLALKG